MIARQQIKMRTNKRYFKCYKFMNGITKIDYWRTNNTVELYAMYDFIQPLGYRKPKLKEGEVIKE